MNDVAAYICSGYEMRIISLPETGLPGEMNMITPTSDSGASLSFYSIAVDDGSLSRLVIIPSKY